MNRKKLTSRIRNWRLTGFIRKCIRLLLHDLFRDMELIKLTNEMILAEQKGETRLRVSGIVCEIAFWDGHLSEMSHDPAFLKERFDPETPLTGFYRETYRRLLQAFPEEEIAILDVGAGPATDLGKQHEGKPLKITAVDPLAPYYDELLDKYGMTLAVRTIFGKAEKLADQFPAESFAWINTRNSLDHAVAPVDAILAMRDLLKPGGDHDLDSRPQRGGTRLLHRFSSMEFLYG